MKSLKAFVAALALLAGMSHAADNCTERLFTQDFMVSRNTDRATQPFTWDRFVGDKELCNIGKYSSTYGDMFMGRTIVQHHTMTCNAAYCTRSITFIRDGISCGPFCWGPDLGADENAHYSVAALYKPATPASLNLSVTPTVSPVAGTVSIDGGTRGATATKSMYVGQESMIEAHDSPNSGLMFKRWEVSVFGVWTYYSGNRTVVVPPKGPEYYRAVFEPAPHKLTLTAVPSGRGLVSGVAVKEIDVPYLGAIPAPLPVATANSGYVFSGWVPQAGGANILNWNRNNPTLSGTLVGDVKLYATFSTPFQNVYFIPELANPNHANMGGILTPDGEQTLGLNTPFTVMARPNAGYQLTGWETCPDDGAIQVVNRETTSEYVRAEVTVTRVGLACNSDGRPTVKAIFEPKFLQLEIIQEGEDGTPLHYGRLGVYAGHETTVGTLTAEGWIFKEWKSISGNPVISQPNSPQTPVTIYANSVIKAIFSRGYQVSLQVQGSGSITPPGPIFLTVNGPGRSLSAQPSAGYSFKGWSNPQGSLQLSNPEMPSTAVSLLEPVPAVLVAHFEPLAIPINGRITAQGTGAGIPGAAVKFRRSDGREFLGATDQAGYFDIGRPPAGSYTVTVTHSCYATLTENINVTSDLVYNRSLARQVLMSASKTQVQTNETTDLSASQCPDAVDYVWTTDLGGAEQKDLYSRNVTASFANAGFKNVRVVVKYADGTSATSTNNSFIEVLICQPGRPALKMSVENKAASGKIEDRCSDGLGTENVAFTADLIVGQCASGSVTSYAWTLRGGAAGNSQSVNLGITASPKLQPVKVTATRDGKSYLESRSFELIECQAPGGTPRLIQNEIALTNKIVNGQSTTLEPVPGNIIRDDDGSTILLADALWDPYCGTCKHQITFQKWVLTWTDRNNVKQSRTYTTENVDIPLDDYGDYTLVGHATTRDVQPGKERDLKAIKTPPRLVKLMPKIPLPTLGTCRSAPFYCQSFYSDVLEATSLDVRKATLTMASKGRGFNNGSDNGNYSYVAVDGPFTLIARVRTLPSGEAGLMIRNSLMTSDRSLFFGRLGGDLIVTHREKFSQDAIPFNIASTDACLRIRREEDGTLNLHSVNANPCPDFDGAWGTARQTGLSLNLSAWEEGRVYLGLGAGGGTGNVEFEGIAFRSGVASTNANYALYQLVEPSQIVQTEFGDGNLVTNSSFESPMEAFTKAGSVNLRSQNGAWTGRHFARITNKSSGQEVGQKAKALLRVTNRDQKAIGLSIRMRYRMNSAFTAAPSLVLSNKDGVAAAPHILPAFAPPTYNYWHEYNQTILYRDISGSPGQEYFQLHLADRTHVISSAQQLDIDDVVVSPLFPNLEARSKPVTNLTFADGMTQPFQGVTAGDRLDIVSARLLDEEGRAALTLPIFASKAPADLNDPNSEFRKVRRDPVASAMAYFNDMSPDPERRRGDNVVDYKPKWSDFREDAGRVDVEPSPLNRTLMTYGRSSGKDQDFKFSYSSSDDRTKAIKTTVMGNAENGRQSVDYQDAFGNIVMTETFGEGEDKMTTTLDKDILGRTWSSKSPDPYIPPRTSTYTTIGQTATTGDPDAGGTESLYDKRGLLRFFRDAQKVRDGQFVAKVYDLMGRLTHVYLAKDASSFTQDLADHKDWPLNNPNATLQAQTFYDLVPAELPAEIPAAQMTNLKGNAVKNVTFTSRGTITTWFSYDERGQLKTEWKEVLNLPIHRTDMTYNLSGQVVKRELNGRRPDGSTLSKAEEFSFDEFNRMQSIKDLVAYPANRELAKFAYWPDGKLRYLDFGNSLSQGMSYRYDESERLVHMQHEVRQVRTENPNHPLYYPSNAYEQRMTYDAAGNLESQTYRLGNVPSPYRGVKYTYDDYNRLADVDHGRSGTSYDAINYAADHQYNSNFVYDMDGQIMLAVRGKGNVASSADYGNYEYYPSSHRLRRITGLVKPGGIDRSQSDNYVYDANGNVIVDKGTKRIFKYDYRNLPVQVTQCATMNGESCAEIMEILEMVYDSDGQRVAKYRTR